MSIREYHFVGLDASSEFGVRKFKCLLKGSLTDDMDHLAMREAGAALDQPLFVTSTGVPEIEIIVVGASVQALFGRNCDHLPIVSITDLDTLDDPEGFWKEHREDLAGRGFTEIPGILYVVEGS